MSHIINQIKIRGMHCTACQRLVQKRVRQISGVDDVEVNIDTGIVIVDASRSLLSDEIQLVLQGTEYEVVEVKN